MYKFKETQWDIEQFKPGNDPKKSFKGQPKPFAEDLDHKIPFNSIINVINVVSCPEQSWRV